MGVPTVEYAVTHETRDQNGRNPGCYSRGADEPLYSTVLPGSIAVMVVASAWISIVSVNCVS
jgi:hypothetical protein